MLHSPPAPRASRVRFGILALVFVNVVINYMDRTNISIAATALSTDLELSPVQMGFIFSAFGWTYAAFQIPGGMLADRMGSRVLYAITLVSWSVVTVLQGFAARFATLFALRLGVGALEAPSYPMNNKVATSWFPSHERAFAIATYTSGQYVGLAFLAPTMASMQHFWGWRMMFVLTGAVGIVWGFVWYWLYRDPHRHPRANQAELDHIRSGGGLVEKEPSQDDAPKTRLTWANLKIVFTNRKLWGIYLGQFCLGANGWFFLAWFPTYLEKSRGLSILKTGYLAAVPFLAAFVGVLLSGFLSDLMVRKGVSLGFARKAPVICGLFLASTIVTANYVESTAAIMVIMAIAFFGTGLASIAWIFVSLLAPKNLLGLTGGAFNFIANLSSVSVPVIIGYLARDGDFAPALVFIAIVGVLGVLSYVFLVGKLERVEVPGSA